MNSKNIRLSESGTQNIRLKHIGNKPISAFIDFEAILSEENYERASELEYFKRHVTNELEYIKPFLNFLDFVDFEADMSGGHISLHVKNKNSNIVTSTIDLIINNYLKEILKEIGPFGRKYGSSGKEGNVARAENKEVKNDYQINTNTATTESAEIESRYIEPSQRSESMPMMRKAIERFYSYGNSKNLEALLTCYGFPIKYYSKDAQYYDDMKSVYSKSWAKKVYSENSILNFEKINDYECQVRIGYVWENKDGTSGEIEALMRYRFDYDYNIVSEERLEKSYK